MSNLFQYMSWLCVTFLSKISHSPLHTQTFLTRLTALLVYIPQICLAIVWLSDEYLDCLNRYQPLQHAASDTQQYKCCCTCLFSASFVAEVRVVLCLTCRPLWVFVCSAVRLPINPSRIIYVCWLLLLLLLLPLCFAACQPVGLGIHLWAVPISSACTAIVRGDHMLVERFECNDICLMTKSDKSNLCWQIKVWRVSFTTQNKYKTQPRKLEKDRKKERRVVWLSGVR